MSDFIQRSMAGAATVGEQLQRVRLSRNETVEHIADNLRIRSEYLVAIEGGNYTVLPGSVFVKNYVRKYAKFLHLNVHELEQQLDQELQIYATRPNIPTTQKHLVKPALRVPKVLLGVVLGVVALTILSYFFFEISHSIQPPPLQFDPLPQQVGANQHTITINGQTAPEANVTINGQTVSVQSDGRFSELMTIQPGINVYKIEAKTKRSKEHIEYLQLVQE